MEVEEQEEQQQQSATSGGLGMMPFSSMWADFIRKKSPTQKLVRYEHPTERRQVSICRALKCWRQAQQYADELQKIVRLY